MSVYCNAIAEQARTGTITAGTGIGTGVFTMGCWVKLVSDLNQIGMFFGHGTSDAQDGYVDSNGTSFVVETNGLSNSAGISLTVGSWYWVTFGRDGSDNMQVRIFDDHASSTTPVGTATVSSYTADVGSDVVWVGHGRYTGSNFYTDAEYESMKLHVGVYWTDSQCRDEALYYTPQTAGGTPWYWRLTNTDADTDGLLEGGQSDTDFDLVNDGTTPLTNGASSPTNLSEASGGGGLLPQMIRHYY